MTMKTLYIVRGIPGSGKSTIAKMTGCKYHFEHDMFFTVAGVYKFDKNKIAEAVQWCMENTESAMSSGENIVVANTFTERYEYEKYLKLAEKNGYSAVVIEVFSNFSSVHNVPDETMRRMRDRFVCHMEKKEKKEKTKYEAMEELAELQFTTGEVAIIMECEESVFESDEKAAAAYMRGKLRAQAEVRKAMLQMAKQGSTPAQKEFQKLAENSRVEACE
jgi:predicted kinase